VLQSLNHPNIVKFLGYVKTREFLHLVMEYVEEGAISAVLKEYGAIPENLASFYMKQFLMGLAYLHKQEVVHRDIKGYSLFLPKSQLVLLIFLFKGQIFC